MKLTTERLREIAERRSPSLRWGEAEKIAAELLATREAQPVAEVLSSRSGNDTSTIDKALPAGTKVYTAPPVPDISALTDLIVDRLIDCSAADDDSIADAETLVYNACRAAMLSHVGDATDKVEPVMICDTCGHDADHQGNRTYKCDNGHVFQMRSEPVSQGCKLPPHAYRELVNSLRDTAVKFSGTDQLQERLNTALRQFIEPDHPHTRTTAPEVSSD